MSIKDYVETNQITTNKKGGKQSYTPCRFDLIPGEALTQAAKTLGVGAKEYGEANWVLITTDDHVNHALQHLYAYLVTREVHHLTHAVCRGLFAYETAVGTDYVIEQTDQLMRRQELDKLFPHETNNTQNQTCSYPK